MFDEQCTRKFNMQTIWKMLPMKHYTCILPAKVSWVLGIVSVASFSAVFALEASLHGLEAADDVVLPSAQLSKVFSHIATLHAR